MTTVMSQFSVHGLNSAAGARESFGGISAMFDSLGMPKTADTGQLDIPAIVAAVTANTYAGYEVRSWNDGTATVFLKVEYGAHGTNNTRVRLRLTLGTGSNGAGTITGQAFQIVVSTTTSGTTPVTGNHFGCRVAGAFWLEFETTGYHHSFVTVERRRDPATGTAVSGDWWVQYTGEGATAAVRCQAASYRTGFASPAAFDSTTTAPDAHHAGVAALGISPTTSSGMFGDVEVTQDVFRLLSAWPEPSYQSVGVAVWNGEAEGGANDPTRKMVMKCKQWGTTRSYLIAVPGAYGAVSRSSAMDLALVWE